MIPHEQVIPLDGMINKRKDFLQKFNINIKKKVVNSI